MKLPRITASLAFPRKRAFSLIELIGVLAIIAILAAIIIPNMLKKLDRIVGDKEAATLKIIGDGLQAKILRDHYIPNHTNWTTTIATELGMSPTTVSTNSRNQPRYFLIDPNLQIGGGGLPYTQTTSGSPLPVSPRIIILSSIGQALTNMSSGIPSSTDFNAIWNWVDGSAIPPASSLFDGFTQGHDLKVQRINLSSLFVHLILTIYPLVGNPGGNYAINPVNFVTTSVSTNGFDAYFLQNSRLRLYATNIIDSEQLLIKDNSFVYNEGVWRSSISGVPPLAGILDFAGLIPSFLAAPPNPGSATTQQQVLDSMLAYMNAYTQWAATSFSDNTLRNQAIAAQGNMMSKLVGLYTPNPAN